MYKYSMGDYIMIKNSQLGVIVDIRELNDVITIFKVVCLSDYTEKELFYGDISPLKEVK